MTAFAEVRVDSLTVASGSTVVARMDQGGGTRYSKASIGAGAAAPSELGGVVDCALRYVAASGFDLRDGIGLRMNISTAFGAADGAARCAFAAAFAAAAAAVAAGGGPPPPPLPHCATELRDALRCALEAWLQRLAYRGLPRGALVLTVEEAGALLDRVEGRAGVGACGGGGGGDGGSSGGGGGGGACDDGGSGGYGDPFRHPAMASLSTACAALPEPSDPRALLRLAHDACAAAFSAPPPHAAPFPSTVNIYGEEVAACRVWVAMGTLGGDAARLAALGGGGGGGGGDGGAAAASAPAPSPATPVPASTPAPTPALPLPPPRPDACALLSPTISPASSLTLNVEAVVGSGGGGARVSLGLSRAPLFVKGRYLKLARGLSQTPWFLNGARKDLAAAGDGGGVGGGGSGGGEEGGGAAAHTSVEEQLGFPISAAVVAAYSGRGVVEGAFAVCGAARAGGGALQPPPAPPAPAALVHAPLFTFHSAGREDVDVRMLGEGRPFAIELNACRPALLPVAEFSRMAALVNGCGGGVVARGLRPATRREFEALAKGADTTRKEYVALVWSEAPFPEGGGLGAALARGLGAPTAPLTLHQRTPIRVLHRRSLLTRKKAVLGGAALRLSNHFFLLHLTTSAGTYVKEFVHGDFGRTQPCLGEVLGGAHCDILALDVVGHREGAAGEGEEEDGEGGARA